MQSPLAQGSHSIDPAPDLRGDQRLRVGEIDICYERHGSGEPLLLVMGIGAQMVAWPDDFVAQLCEQGFEVVIFDHRDVGLSTHMTHLPVPDPRKMIVRGLAKAPVDVPYTLADMADDAHGLMRGLGFRRYNVFGISLGGMVSQMLAIRYPGAVKSLCSVMSTTGERRYSVGDPRAIAALLKPPPRTIDEAGENLVNFFRVVGSTGYAQNISSIRARGRLAFARALNPAGFARHLGAMVATGSRRDALRQLRVPTTVIHGQVDPLIPHRGGAATARHIPGAEFMSIPGMGHDLPPALQRPIAEAVVRLVERAGA